MVAETEIQRLNTVLIISEVEEPRNQLVNAVSTLPDVADT